MVRVLPEDAHNRKLVRNVHPPDWTNPQPASVYDLVVLGAGTAGLVSAIGAASLGARVAIVERELMGGDCLNVGCVPSKALIRSSRAYAQARDASEYGVHVPSGVRVDFAAVMERMRKLRADISPHDSAARLSRLGIDVFLGEGSFIAPQAARIGNEILRFRRAVIATGARAAAPPIPGLEEAGYLTNESLFSLTELPPRLAVLGGGPIGSEMAQSFARFGAEVYLIERESHILPREDADAAERVQDAFRRDGVHICLNSTVCRVGRDGEDKIVSIEQGGVVSQIRVDEILVGLGRAPNVQRLNLEAAGVRYNSRTGVEVNDRLQTTNPRIFAAGDIASRFKFTHAADAMARIVLQNALFFGRAKASALTIPWSTYTDPELAHVGLSEKEAARRGIAIESYLQELSEVDRAVLDGESEGFVKVHVKKGTDEIVGATIVAAHAGDLLSEITTAMAGGMGLGALSKVIHPYPTQAEAIRKLGDQYRKSRLTPFVRSVIGKWLSLWRWIAGGSADSPKWKEIRTSSSEGKTAA